MWLLVVVSARYPEDEFFGVLMLKGHIKFQRNNGNCFDSQTVAFVIVHQFVRNMQQYACTLFGVAINLNRNIYSTSGHLISH